jgi:hypothetical protein
LDAVNLTKKQMIPILDLSGIVIDVLYFYQKFKTKETEPLLGFSVERLDS